MRDKGGHRRRRFADWRKSLPPRMEQSFGRTAGNKSHQRGATKEIRSAAYCWNGRFDRQRLLRNGHDNWYGFGIASYHRGHWCHRQHGIFASAYVHYGGDGPTLRVSLSIKIIYGKVGTIKKTLRDLNYQHPYMLQRYLAVVSGVISEADFIFVPESPPPVDWPEKLCDKLKQARMKKMENGAIPYIKIRDSILLSALSYNHSP